MAQSYEVKLGDYQDTINVTIEGQEQVIAVLRTIQNELDGLGLSKFYGDEKKLIDNVTNAMREFSRENGKTQANAENLIKTINALSGIQGKDWSEFFPDADSMRDMVSEARKLAGVLNGYSVDNFREAGIAFDGMGAGFEAFRARIDALIGGEGDIAKIKAELAASAAETERLTRQVDSLNDELRETQRERDRALDGGKIREFNDLIAQAEKEFNSFLAANNINPDSLWDDNEYNEILSDLREGIITSSEAIARFKGAFRELLPKEASEGLEVFFAKLEEITGKLGEMQADIQNLHSGGAASGVVSGAAETVTALDGERRAVSELVGLTPDADAFTKILLALANAADGTGDQTSRLASELKPLVDMLHSLTESADAEKLQSVSRIIGGIKDLSEFKLRPASLKNLKEGLDGLSKVQNTKVLNELSAVDLRKLGEVRSNKAALEGLATYLPVIASVDADNLKKLQGLDLSGLGNVKIPEVPKDNITNLAEFGRAITETVTGVKALTDSLNAAGRSGTASLQNLVSGGMSRSQIGSILKSGLGADGVFTTNTSLRHIGMTPEEAERIANELGSMYGNITNVSAEWKTFANGAKDAAVVTVKAVGDVGEALSQKLIYRLQDVKDEAGEVRKEWKLDESGKASIDYGAIKKAAEAERKAAEKAAEAERKAAEKAAEAERKAAEADRKAAEKAAEADRKAAEESQRLAEQMANGRADAARERIKAAEQAAQEEIRTAEEEAEKKRQISEKNVKQAESELTRLKALRIDYQNQIDRAGELGIDNNTVSGLRNQVEEIDRMIPELEKIASGQGGAAASMDAYKDSVKRAREELALLKKQLSGDIKSSGAFVPMNSNQTDIASRTISARRTALGNQIDRATAAGFGGSEQVSTLRELIPLYDDLEKQVKENTVSQADYTEWMRLFKAVADDVGVTLDDNVKDAEKLEKQYGSLMDAMNTAKFDNETQNGVWGMASEEDIQKLDRLKQEMGTLSESYASGKIDVEQYAKSLNGISLEYGELTASVTKNSRMQKLADQEAAKRRSEILKGINIQRTANSEVSNATKMLRDYSAAEHSRNEESKRSYSNIGIIRDKLISLNADYTAGRISLEDYTRKVNDYSAALRENGAVIEVNGDNHMTWFGKVGKALNTHLTTLSATAVIGSAMREVRQMVSTVIEIDTAMTELRKVTDETDARYTRFLDNAAARAKKLSATISDTVTATADFARLGLSIDQAEAAADAAIVYKAVGDDIDSIDDAAQSIISTMQAFNIQTEDVMGIVDRFNKVGNEFAISSGGIGDILLRSASAMHAANNTLEETIALGTAANTIIQNPQTVGTTLKTISMYLRSAKAELEAAGEETEGMAESTAELRELILQITRKYGEAVDIMTDDNTFKSTYEILREISKVWDKITDEEDQAALLKKLGGGVRNGNAIAAILENFDIAEKALESASNAENSAMEELGKFQESIQGHIVGFKTAYQELAQTLVDGSLVKSFIDIGKWALNALTVVGKFADALGGLRTAAIILGGNMLGHGLSALVRTLRDASAEAGHFKSGIAGVIQMLIDARKAGKTFGDVMKTVMSSLGTAPGILTLISMAVSGVMLAIDYFNKKQEEMIERAHEIKEAYSDALDTYHTNITTLEGLRDEFEKLSEGVNEHGGNVSLTADEYNRYLELIDQIVAISPQVIEGYNKEGDAVIDYKKALEKAIDKQNEYLKNQRAIMLGGGEELFSGNAAELDRVTKKLRDRVFQNKLGEDTLAGSLNVAGLDYVRAAETASAWVEAAREVGVVFNPGETWGELPVDDIITLYENADRFMYMLRESGAYTEQELAVIQTRLNALAAPITEYNALIQDGTQYLQEWVKDQEWYENIPDEALSGFNKGLSDIVAQGADFGATLNATIAYGNRFAEVFGSDQVKALEALAGGLGDASQTEEEAAAKMAEYREEVDKFLSGLSADPATINTLTSYLDQLAALNSRTADTSGGAAGSMTQAERDFADFKKQIGDLGRALGEFQEQGSVSSETYQELAKGNEKYAELFTITGNGVELNTDKLNTYVESLKQEYGAKLAMNGAAAEEIGILAALADTLITEAETTEDAATEIAELRKYIDSMKEGTQLSGAEVDKLVKKYPRLAGAVKNAGKGYRVEISALEDLIELKAEYIRLTEQETSVTEARNRLNLHNNGNTTAAAKIDEIFAKYQEAYGRAIASFEDFKKGYEDVFGYAYEGSYEAYEDYINALIDKNEALIYALMRVKDAAEGADEGLTTDTVKETTQSVSDLISELDKLSGMVTELNEGTEYSTTEALNLIMKYPVLRDHIIKTANGYKFEASAIKELIAAKIQLMQTADMETRVKEVRSNLRNANADRVDSVFAKYLAENGRNIQTMEEFKAAYKAYNGFVVKTTSTPYAQAKLDALNGALANDTVTEMIDSYLTDPLPGYKPDTSSSGSSSTEDAETEFEKAYKLHQHYLAMNQETEEQYLNWLDGAYKASFAAGEMELDDYYKYEEEVYEKRKQLFQTSLDESQHQIDLLSHQLGDTSEEQIAIYEQMQKKVSAQANAYRASGIRDNDELIRELQNQWWQYEENIRQLRESAFSDWLSDRKFVIEQLKQDKAGSDEILNSWKDVLERIKDEIEYYSARGYDITTDVIQNLMKELQSAKEAMIAELDDVVAKANEVVDGFQNIYTTLTNAAKEYASTGYLSVDSLQAILALGPKYMTMLDSENGQLVINEQSLQKIIAARTDEMAAETALSYAKQVLLATEQDEVQTLRDLAGIQAASSSNIWEQAYATLGYARALGASKGISDDYYASAIANVQKMQSVSKTAADTVADYYRTLDDGYVSQADGLETILKLTEDMIKQENSDRIDALEKEKDLYKDIIDEKKEILRLTKEQDDHDRDMADKLKEIADLQSKIDQLALDDSREAGAQRAKLEAQLLEKQKALADDQADYAYDAQVDALDKQYDAFEEEKDDEIDALKEELNSAEKLYRAAIDRISNGWDTLYNDLLNWNYNYGNTLEKDLTNAWKAAQDAAERYGDFVSALDGVKEHDKLGPDSADKEISNAAVQGGADKFASVSGYINRMRANSLAWFTSDNPDALAAENKAIAKELEGATGEKLSYNNSKGVWTLSDGRTAYSLSDLGDLTDREVGHAVVSAMKANSAAWGSASESERRRLEEKNNDMAKRLSGFLGKPITKTAAGVWMIGGEKLYDIYHRGGIAGGRGTVKQNEVMALLEKGEAVLDERRESALYKTIDFVQMLSDKIGHAIDKGRISSLLAGTGRSFPAMALPALAGGVGTMNFAPTVQVTIAGAGDLSESTARKYGSIAADTVLEQLKSAFTQRGVSASGNSILK